MLVCNRPLPVRCARTPDSANRMHEDHCIEALREAITCFSDTSAFNFEWYESQRRLGPKIHSLHMCRNFEKIQDWTSSRVVGIIDQRKHVEGGIVKDYSGFDPEPKALLDISKLLKTLKHDLADL